VQLIRRADQGPRVRDVQSRLLGLGFRIEAAELEAQTFGESTEAALRNFQQERGLLVDAVVGLNTWHELIEAGYALGDRVLYLRYPFTRGDDVRALQRRLNLLGFDPGREDGILGEQTGRAIVEFQRNVGLRADGIVGATTTQALDRLLAAPVTGLGRTAVRETEGLRATGASLRGRRVAIDPGHGPEDPGFTGPGGSREADIVFALAGVLGEELNSRGANALVLRSAEEDPDSSARAARANDADAEVLISLHLNGHDDPSAEGSSSYYFGGMGSGSVAGQALAELVQEELTAALGLRDGRAHTKAFPILRETRMTAVQIEPCFVTNPKEELLLGEEPFRREVVRAIADAVERYFAGREMEASGPATS
jgi:N-acetylmuramoyl-L-alanine amidase